jgi:MFS family permease
MTRASSVSKSQVSNKLPVADFSLGGVIVTDDFLELHDLTGKTNVIATLAAIYDIGCFLGALVAFTIGERLGRKKTIVWGTAIMTIGVILKTSSYSLAQMFVGRIVLG